MRIRQLTLLLTQLLTLLSAATVTAADYAATMSKAERFFAHREWASASAMYQLLIDERPDETANYARAIVAEGMLGRQDAGMQYFNSALARHIPLERLLGEVRTVSFGCGATDLYERFLLAVQHSHSWMTRVIDGYLLDYYSFRCDGPRIVTYSTRMLAGLPDDPRYLHMLARGYLLDGDFDRAMDVYRHIVDTDPDNADALLALALYYGRDPARTAEVKDWLQRAYALRPTPYVARLLGRTHMARSTRPS